MTSIRRSAQPSVSKKTSENKRLKTDETTRLTAPARSAVLKAVELLNQLGMPGLAQHLHPVTNELIPASERDALLRIGTLRLMLKAKPMVMTRLEPVLREAEQVLKASEAGHRRTA